MGNSLSAMSFILALIISFPYLSIMDRYILAGASFCCDGYGGGGVYNYAIYGRDGFGIIALNLSANLLRRSLSIIGGNTRSNNTYSIIDLIRDLSGAYLI